MLLATYCYCYSYYYYYYYYYYHYYYVFRASFRAVPHARAVVEGTCAQLARRFPPGKALRAVEEACDALVEEHEEALARYLAGGARAEKALAGCDLGSVEPWRSPWATRRA